MADQADFEKSQKEMMDALKKLMGEVRPVGMAPDAARQETEETRRQRREKAFEFSLTPKQVKKHLDRFVIRQDEAKRVLATTVCDHYHHVRVCKKGDACKDYAKQNVILLGPTGVGKTYLIKNLAELIGVPFVKADATKFSETGYVGRDVDDLIRDLVERAEGDLELAEYGIVYLDEVDKIARSSNALGRDVSGSGVQQGLLKIMEETEVALRNPQDLQSQMEGLMEFQKSGKTNRPLINTRHILFIVSGAFGGLDQIVKKRVTSASIGFQKKENQLQPMPEADVLRNARTDDFIQYGFEPEFIGRLPVRAVLNPLSSEDLYLILTSSEGSILRQYKAAFEAYGIDVTFPEKTIWEIAKRAEEEKTGARGLLTVLERVLRDVKYELPSSKIKHFTLEPYMVADPAEALKTVLKKEFEERKSDVVAEIEAYEKKFYEKTKFSIRFDEGAREAIERKVIEEDAEVAPLLDQLLSNYDYGLRLIQSKKPRKEFILPADAVREPNLLLDRWIKEAYEESA